MKQYRPTSPGRRQMSVVPYRNLLSASEPHKPLLHGGRRRVGRNNQGRITTRHKGSGHKRLFRDVDFLYDKKDIPARVLTIEYDPNRSGFIGLVSYRDGEKRYLLLPQGVKVGDTVVTSDTAPLSPGNRLPIGKILPGTFVYNVELKPGGGAKLARSAGNYVEIVAIEGGYAQLKLPSTEVRKVPASVWASIGAVSNEENQLMSIGKAGRSRWLGIRPTVRGSAMNPVDHPYGGGEGKQGRGRRRLVTMWGKPAGKGQKSRHPKKYSNKFIVSRRKIRKRE